MNITEQRLKDYQLQMSIYAEQHQILLASDVLDMIEQLRDDLKDDTDKIAKQMENDSSAKLYGSKNSNNYLIPVERAVEIVKGGVEE